MSTPLLADLPLFPLRTVLFPGGLLPLKIFEARYLDMASKCLRESSPFGVCLLKSGAEVATPDQPQVPETIGCLAEIIACDVPEFGIMMLRTRGTRRFRLLSHRTEANGLLCGMAELLAADAPATNGKHLAKLAACAEVLERVIATINEREPGNLPFLAPFQFTDTAWVANRLAEVLPIPTRARQKLMELDDATARLDLVHHYMKQHQLL